MAASLVMTACTSTSVKTDDDYEVQVLWDGMQANENKFGNDMRSTRYDL